MNINVDSIPSELRDLRQWVCWRLETRDGKPTKVPYQVNGEKAQSNNAATWTTFAEAFQELGKGRFTGIGFVLTSADPFVAWDLDGCRNLDTGDVEAWAQPIVDELNSYTEVTPSGKGLRIIVKAKLPPEGRKKGHIEVYDSGRYITVTGHCLDGCPRAIQERRAQTTSIHTRVFGRNGRPGRKSAPTAAAVGDEELLRLAEGGPEGEKFQLLWQGITEGYPSQSEADLALCGILARLSGGDPKQIDTLFRRSGLYRAKWDRRHGSGGQTYGELTIARALLPPSSEAQSTTTGDSIAVKLMRYVREAALVHSREGLAYALIEGRRALPVNLRGSPFRAWLSARYTTEHGKPPRSGDLTDVLGAVTSLAISQGPERRVHTRVAEHEGGIYVDLGRPDPAAIRITAEGWEVVQRPPVLFAESEATAPLPEPAEDGGAQDLLRLRELLGLFSADFYLAVCWLIGAWQPGHPYPVLLLTGPAGSGKSTVTRMLRSLVDPAGPDGRIVACPPREGRDLFAAAAGTHVLAIDNLSSVPSWLSDLLSSMATGSGQLTRRLYTDSDIAVVQVQRPIILNGISVAGLGSDLRDRAIALSLQCRRQPITENELWHKADEAAPYVLAGLCDCVSMALRNRATVDSHTLHLPRMADFAEWVVAAQPALHQIPGFEDLDFLTCYQENRNVSAQEIIENDPVGAYLLELARGTWEGTAKELLETLDGMLTDDHGAEKAKAKRSSKAWPKSPEAAGSRLARLIPQLGACGVNVEKGSEGKKRFIRISQVEPL